MIVDSHAHVNFRGMDADALVRRMDAQGIDCSWALTWEEASPALPGYQHLSAGEVMEAHSKYSRRIIPLCAPDPTSIDGIDRLLQLHSQGVRGYGELKVRIGWEMPIVTQLLKILKQLKMPLIFHMEDSSSRFCPDSRGDVLLARLLETQRFGHLPRLLEEGLECLYEPLAHRRRRIETVVPGYLADFAALELRLQEFPTIQFVGHGPLFWKGICGAYMDSRALYPKTPIQPGGITKRLLSEYPNLHADLSASSGFNALARDLNHAKKFLAEFSNKLLFGTDNFDLGLAELIKTCGLDPNRRKQIMGENAMALIPS
jgi:hypothetical protein